ncbi:MAG: sulfur carrier protein ThiS [Candidatus Hydrothermarchaeales archaeon]
MEIIVKLKNEERVTIREGSTIEDLLRKLNINRESVLIRRNGEISPEEEFLQDEDFIEIISVISGG